MLARSCLRSTRSVGAVRNGAVNTSKVRFHTTDCQENMEGGQLQEIWDSQLRIERQLTVGFTACRLLLELHRRRRIPLPIERRWISCHCNVCWINCLVLSSLWHRTACDDADRRRVSNPHRSRFAPGRRPSRENWAAGISN